MLLTTLFFVSLRALPAEAYLLRIDVYSKYYTMHNSFIIDIMTKNSFLV